MIIQIEDDEGMLQSSVAIDDLFWATQKLELQRRVDVAYPGWLLVEAAPGDHPEPERNVGSAFGVFDTWLASLDQSS